MANTQTAVPLFVANQVLTAAQQNISAGTGVPVFATTVTRDAAFGGSNKVLAEGQLCYLESTDVVQYYTGAAWATVGPATASALTLISATTIGTTVASVTVSSAFSATYDNYEIILSGGVASTGVNLGLQLGSTTTGYYAAYPRLNYSDALANNASDNNGSSFSRCGAGSTNSLTAHFYLLAPNLAKNTVFQTFYNDLNTTSAAGTGSGFANNSTQFTAFTITPSSGTLTGGTIRVYGYSNS